MIQSIESTNASHTHSPVCKMRVMKNTRASIRIQKSNPDHHLFNNNGTWWIHYTIYPTAVTTERVRESLETRDLLTARKRRDAIFAQLFDSVS
jgi:hypothetical protein